MTVSHLSKQRAATGANTDDTNLPIDRVCVGKDLQPYPIDARPNTYGGSLQISFAGFLIGGRFITDPFARGNAHAIQSTSQKGELFRT